MSAKKIILTGHFDIGEKYAASARLLVESSKQQAGKKLILVGDIGIADKLFAYIRKGIDGVVLTYHIRHHCAQSACVLAQLPKTETDIRSVIDIAQYAEMALLLREKFPAIYRAIEKNDGDALARLKQVQTDWLTEKLVQDRLQHYNLTTDEIWVVREKFLRNRVGRKVKRDWNKLASFTSSAEGLSLGGENITTASRKPLCRGIIFALNELIAEYGYTAIDYFIEDRHLQLMQKGWNLFERCRSEFGENTPPLESARFITENDVLHKV